MEQSHAARARRNAIPVVACLVAASLVVASQRPPFDNYAAWLWGLATIALGGGLWSALRSRPTAQRP